MNVYGKLLAATTVAVLLVGAFVLTYTQRAGTGSVQAVTNLTTAEKAELEKAVGLELRDNPTEPGISVTDAISTAIQQLGSQPAVSPQASSWIANETIPGGSDMLEFKDRPVWIVTLQGFEMARSGPPDSNIPKICNGRRDLVIDSTTGAWLYTAETCR